MKNSWEWDENDLLIMVKAGTQESVELDFKDSKALQNVKGQKDVRYEISKDVSALANSAGGTLIYGMVENGHVATGLDVGNDPNIVTKEWLQQIINSTIHRKIEGVRVNQIELATTSPGRVAYVVYVPQSTRTPHQALDKKFYKRYEFESAAMEEYEIRDLYRRGQIPDLRMMFALKSDKLVVSQDGIEAEPFALHTTISNDAIEPAEYAVIKIFIDTGLIVVSSEDFKVREGTVTIANRLHKVNLLSMNWGIPGKLPIFDMPFALSEEPIKLKEIINEPGKQRVYLLGYEIQSPRMPVKLSYVFLTIMAEKIGFLFNGFLTAEEAALKYVELGL